MVDATATSTQEDHVAGGRARRAGGARTARAAQTSPSRAAICPQPAPRDGGGVLGDGFHARPLRRLGRVRACDGRPDCLRLRRARARVASGRRIGAPNGPRYEPGLGPRGRYTATRERTRERAGARVRAGHAERADLRRGIARQIGVPPMIAPIIAGESPPAGSPRADPCPAPACPAPWPSLAGIAFGREARDRCRARGPHPLGEHRLRSARGDLFARGGALERSVSPAPERRDDARAEQDAAPGRDRRGLRALRLLAIQRLLRASRSIAEQPDLAAGRVEPIRLPAARRFRLRGHAVQFHGHRGQPADRAGAARQHGGLEAVAARAALRAPRACELLAEAGFPTG